MAGLALANAHDTPPGLQQRDPRGYAPLPTLARVSGGALITAYKKAVRATGYL